MTHPCDSYNNPYDYPDPCDVCQQPAQGYYHCFGCPSHHYEGFEVDLRKVTHTKTVMVLDHKAGQELQAQINRLENKLNAHLRVAKAKQQEDGW